MKTFLASSVTRVALVVAIVCIPALRVSAQDLPEAKPLDDMKALAAKPTPKTPDGHPDLNGRWLAPRLTRGVRGSYGKIVGNEHQLIFGIPVTGDAETDAAVTEKLNDIKHQTAKKREETRASIQAGVRGQGQDDGERSQSLRSDHLQLSAARRSSYGRALHDH